MNKLNETNKKTIKICIFIAICILIIATVAILIIRYNNEGEKNLPFEIKSLKIISKAQGEVNPENIWELNVIQHNDFYFYIDKNPNYSKEDSITKVSFENFKFEKKSDVGTIDIYKPSANNILYSFTDEYKISDTLSYTGSLNTNIQSLEISNQGGLIGFSIVINDLGTYLTDENSEVIHDGTLLSKLDLTQEDISITVSFDIIIETSSKNKFKATLNFDLPTGNIIEDGISVLDKNNFDDIVFKRF